MLCRAVFPLPLERHSCVHLTQTLYIGRERAGSDSCLEFFGDIRTGKRNLWRRGDDKVTCHHQICDPSSGHAGTYSLGNFVVPPY